MIIKILSVLAIETFTNLTAVYAHTMTPTVRLQTIAFLFTNTNIKSLILSVSPHWLFILAFIHVFTLFARAFFTALCIYPIALAVVSHTLRMSTVARCFLIKYLPLSRAI